MAVGSLALPGTARAAAPADVTLEIAPGASTRYTMTPKPAGFRWYHMHMFAGKNLTKAQYAGLHGFLLIEPRDNPTAYDREVFLSGGAFENG
jgi:FtsP/CotA-like multicopper oxidase with cupredoxin domain